MSHYENLLQSELIKQAQEMEETIGTCLEEINQLKAEIKELKRKNARKRTGLKKKQSLISQLKAENEELKNFHINLVGVKECEIKELTKYKQALKEIKEIASLCSYATPLDFYETRMKQILEKISEVIDE